MLNQYDNTTYQEYLINNFDGGINTDMADSQPNELLDAINVSFTSRGSVEKRQGLTELYNVAGKSGFAGTEFTSIVEFEDDDTKCRVVTCGNHMYQVGTTTANAIDFNSITTIFNAFPQDVRPATAVQNDRAFFATGASNPFIGCHNNSGTIVPYRCGLPKPTTDPVVHATANTGGYMSDGVYKFKYAFYRSEDGFYGELSDSVEVTLSGGTSTQKVTIRCQPTGLTPSGIDYHADKVYVFRTYVGTTNTIYYKVAEASIGTIASYSSNVDVDCTIDDDGIAVANVQIIDGMLPPDDITYIYSLSNRMFVASGKKIYYSRVNEPEVFPDANYSEDITGTITGLGAVQNALLIFTKDETYIYNASQPATSKPYAISNNIGCDSHWTIQPIEGGQGSGWLSREGLAMTNGKSIFLISKNKVSQEIRDGRDFSLSSEAFGLYSSELQQGFFHIPYAGSLYQMWSYLPVSNGVFSKHNYSITPQIMGTVTNENDETCIIAGRYANSKLYFTHIYDGTYTDDGADINMSFETIYHSMDKITITKQMHKAWVKWTAGGNTTAKIYLGIDREDRRDNDTIDNEGSSLWGTFVWGVDKWGLSGTVQSVAHFNLHEGETFNIEFNETSAYKITVDEFGVLFKVLQERPEGRELIT